VGEEARIRLQAKRFNEHVKLVTTTLNAISLVALGAGAVQPMLAETPDPVIR